MGLATPTSIMVGTGRAAEMGVLFRKGDALQTLQEAARRGARQDRHADRGAARADRPDRRRRASTRPTVLRAGRRGRGALRASDRRGDRARPRAPRAARCRGRRLRVDHRATACAAEVEGRTRAGRRRPPDGRARASTLGALAETRRRAWRARAQTPLYAAIDGQARRCHRAWPTRSSRRTPAAIAALHALGLKVAMITGDNQAHGARPSRAELGIDHVVAEVLPDGKVAALDALARTAARWPLSATASTTRPRWPRPTSASPSAPAPTWPSRRPTWC